MKKICVVSGFGLILFALVFCAVISMQQRMLSEKLIRFHVTADSDSEPDQALKLQVRDALLEELSAICAQAQSREQMIALLTPRLSRLQHTAEAVLRENGCADCVRVTLQQEIFPTRYYDTFALPAGDYLSLRVQLGKGAGHNWWCVCFPSLCESACTQELSGVAAGAGFSDEEIDLITHCEEYEIRFKVLEWLAALRKDATHP